VTDDGTECSFRGTYLEVEPPVRTVETWLCGGWPYAGAVETWQLHETDGVTTLTMRLAFRDKAGRDHYPASGEAGELNSSDGPALIVMSRVELRYWAVLAVQSGDRVIEVAHQLGMSP